MLANKIPRADWLGVSASLWISSTAFLGVALANIGMVLLLIAMLANGRRLWVSLKDEGAVFHAWMLCFITATFSLLLALVRDGGGAHLGGYLAFLKLGLFLPMGWYLGFDLRFVWLSLGGALAGFLVGRVLSWPIHVGLEQAMLDRYGFGLTAISFGTYCAIGLMGLLVASARLRIMLSAWGGFAYLMLGAVMSFMLAGVLFSLSRAVVLVFFLVAIAVFIFFIWINKKFILNARRIGVGLALVLITFCLFLFGNDIFKQRLFAEADVYRLLLEGDFNAVRYSSVGLRVHAWYYAWECWLSHPWLGWGPGVGGSQLLQVAPDVALRELSHFHNIAVEWLVRLGGVGLIAALGLLFALVNRIFWVWRSGFVPRDLIIIIVSGLAILLLTGMSNFRLLSSDGRFCWLILASGAVAITFYTRHRAKVSA